MLISFYTIHPYERHPQPSYFIKPIFHHSILYTHLHTPFSLYTMNPFSLVPIKSAPSHHSPTFYTHSFNPFSARFYHFPRAWSPCKWPPPSHPIFLIFIPTFSLYIITHAHLTHSSYTTYPPCLPLNPVLSLSFHPSIPIKPIITPSTHCLHLTIL